MLTWKAVMKGDKWLIVSSDTENDLQSHTIAEIAMSSANEGTVRFFASAFDMYSALRLTVVSKRSRNGKYYILDANAMKAVMKVLNKLEEKDDVPL
jgi:flagellar motor protein MotB